MSKTTDKPKADKKKTPRKARKLTMLRVEKAVTGSFGVMKDIAAKLKCSRQALYDFLAKDENKYILDLIANETDDLLDTAESALGKLLRARKPDFQTIKFILTTKGKKRGYTLKYEVEGKNYDVQSIMKELENNIPASLPYVERLARGEDIAIVYGEYQQFRRNSSSESTPAEVAAQ